ncbi:hypothetical protein E2C01_054549 [Portunus trituberculatus]|uniref:Uncharacterized protein n=1 Tax=Portunus trituberculatus TaxID=210409 RepID=A0A5B7GNZ3_PORTR|nr:hypothetical protein [Portunus trituberculatus]
MGLLEPRPRGSVTAFCCTSGWGQAGREEGCGAKASRGGSSLGSQVGARGGCVARVEGSGRVVVVEVVVVVEEVVVVVVVGTP